MKTFQFRGRGQRLGVVLIFAGAMLIGASAQSWARLALPTRPDAIVGGGCNKTITANCPSSGPTCAQTNCNSMGVCPNNTHSTISTGHTYSVCGDRPTGYMDCVNTEETTICTQTQFCSGCHMISGGQNVCSTNGNPVDDSPQGFREASGDPCP